MEDFDFDKLYADKMRRGDVPDFSDEDWERLLPKLDADRQRRTRAFPLWWLGLLSGLLLCSNLGWWYMWHQSEKRTDALQQEWQQFHKETITHRDTTFERVVVYQYDTIYRTVVIRSTLGSAAPNNTISKTRQNPLSASAGDVSTQSKSLGNLPESAPVNTPAQPATTNTNTASAETGIISQQPADDDADQTAAPASPVADTAVLSKPTEEPDVQEQAPVAASQKKNPRPQILVPRKFRLGVGAGFVIPQAENLSNNTGFSTSLTGEIAFSDQLALTIEGAFIGIGFKGTVYDEKLGLPPLQSPGVDYDLKYFETDEGYKPILQLTTGMRYWLLAKHKLSPYLGIGYAMQWHLPFELQIEFLNPVTGKEKERSEEVPAISKPVSMLNMNAGLRYRFSPHWFWQTGLDYQFKLDENQPGIPRYWGIKSTILYGF